MSTPANVIPLYMVPKSAIKGGSTDMAILRTLRDTADIEDGYFLLRYEYLQVPTGTFVLSGNIRLNGRWMLGRIRQHATQPGRYEILIRRLRTCYYISVDTKEALAEEIRFMAQDADFELSASLRAESAWQLTSDSMFHDLGFSSDSVENLQVGH